MSSATSPLERLSPGISIGLRISTRDPQGRHGGPPPQLSIHSVRCPVELRIGGVDPFVPSKLVQVRSVSRIQLAAPVVLRVRVVICDALAVAIVRCEQFRRCRPTHRARTRPGRRLHRYLLHLRRHRALERAVTSGGSWLVAARTRSWRRRRASDPSLRSSPALLITPAAEKAPPLVRITSVRRQPENAVGGEHDVEIPPRPLPPPRGEVGPG